MTEPWALGLAAAVWVGCVLSFPVPWWLAVTALVLALAVRSPATLLVAGLLGGLAAGAHADALYVPMTPARFEGVVMLASLPDNDTFSERAEFRLPEGDRVIATVVPSAGTIRFGHVGNRFRATGNLRPIDDSPWWRSRHVTGRLSVSSIRPVDDGPLHWRAAGALQRTVERAASLLPERSEALYQGLVTGDDRSQGAAQRAVFRRVGLSHILAVSGQNVAFVLVLLHLLIGFVPGWGRLPLVVAGLAVFAMLTQLEPSVLRATVTAGVGYWAVLTGRRAAGLRLMATAVSALLLVDPFLAGSVGFQLSVLASLGILVLGPAIAGRLRGPQVLRLPVAVTIAAQVAVTPLLLGSFGVVSPVSIPANVLVGWSVGFVMMWGMSIGLVAGVVSGDVGFVLMLPVRPLLWWIDAVALWAAELPVPVLNGSRAAILAALVVAAALVPQVLRTPVVAMGSAALLVVGSGTMSPIQELDGGGTLLGRGGAGTVLVLASGVDDRVVGSVLNSGVGSIDVVVVTGGHRGVSDVVAELRSIVTVGEVFGPPLHTVNGARRVLSDIEIDSEVGTVRIRVETRRRLVVEHRGRPVGESGS